MENVTGECEMQIDLEALCKVYLLTEDSEFCSTLDGRAGREERDQIGKIMLFDKDISMEDAKELASIYRCGMTYGFVALFNTFMRMIANEVEKEYKEFEREIGSICPICKDQILIPHSDHIPVMDSMFITSRKCQKCGYKYEFPKAALVRDIFTEYTQKKEEKE